jgi:N-acylneuraminate cytidylyltransferase
VTRVVVSTEDGEIATAAVAAGAEIVHRPAELAGDKASSESALLHVLDQLREKEQYEPDLVVFLQATSPLRSATDIDEAVRRLKGDSADSLFSACRVHGFVWRRTGSAFRSLSYNYLNRKLRQDIGDDLLENGSIYVFTPEILRESGNRLGGKIAVHEMDPLHSFQVDEEGDLELIEKIMKMEGGELSIVPDLSNVRLLVLDFDGVMTDDRVLVHQDGKEAVVCHRGDGFGIERVRRIGVDVLVLSKETNPVVAARCQKLGIECHQGFDDKLPKLQSLAAERGLGPEHVVYVGNDVNDLECVQWVGVGVAVADARPELRRFAQWVTTAIGGQGAVREVCDRLLLGRDQNLQAADSTVD